MITLKIYFNWFLVNVLFCLIPIIISTLIINEINFGIISSIISYCFTILISSLYIFDRVSNIESSLKWGGFFIAFILLSLYIFYPNLASDNQIKWASQNLYYLLISVLSITLFLSFVLNLPSMKDIIKMKKEQINHQKTKKLENRVDDIVEQLRREK